MGMNTIMFAIDLESIAMMPCNPAIGGTGKGHDELTCLAVCRHYRDPLGHDRFLSVVTPFAPLPSDKLELELTGLVSAREPDDSDDSDDSDDTA